jgi:hypothetical protein
MQKIDGYGSSFRAAINNSDKTMHSLGMLERQRVKNGLKQAGNRCAGGISHLDKPR